MEFIEETTSNAVIKVIGVGGGGGNVVNTIVQSKLEGIHFVAVNTDTQALNTVQGAEQVQLGNQSNRGLGAGGKEEVAQEAARQDADRLREIIKGSDMIFITAGMGGGTGTGAAPVIAEIAEELGILTIAIVTRPFEWESRDDIAQRGIDALEKHVDSLIVVPNDKLQEILDENIGVKEAFRESDKVLSSAVTGICEVINKTGHINVDFADVKTVMSHKGVAIMGTAMESGVDRASLATRAAIESPLLEDVNPSGARGILVNVSGSEATLTLREITEIMSIVKENASSQANVFFGAVFDDSIGDSIRVTVVATGLRRISGGQSADSDGGNKETPAVMKTGRIGRQGTLFGNEVPALIRKQIS